MKTMNIFSHKERGQVLVFIAIIFLLVLIPLTALFIDGGLIMRNKRQAQAAADAGALAGARSLCKKVSPMVAAENYVEKNKATFISAIITYNISKILGEVTVTASVSTPSYFARLIGIDTLSSNAQATAGCFIPSRAGNILPLAWKCDRLAGRVCPVTYNKEYVFIDAGNGVDTPETTCPEMKTDKGVQGTMVCDLDGDGVNEVFGGGNRSWLGLDYTLVSERNVIDWLTPPDFYLKQVSITPPSSPLTVPPWFYAKAGDSITVYQKLNTLAGRSTPFLLPVIDAVSSDGKMWSVGGFSTFYLTCVNLANPAPYSKNKPYVNTNTCTSPKYMGSTWLDLNKIYSSRYTGFTVEGYFVDNYDWGNIGGSGGIDVGIYYVSLIH